MPVSSPAGALSLAMVVEGQPAVSFTVPSRLAAVSAAPGGLVLSFGVGSALVPDDHVPKLVRKMQEAKRKRCGQFKLVVSFPADDVPTTELDRIMHRRMKRG